MQLSLTDKQPNQADRLLRYLKDRRKAYIWEIVRDLHIYQYNARIFDLRNKGYDIVHHKDSVGGDYYQFTPEALGFENE